MGHCHPFLGTCDWTWPAAAYINTGFDTEPDTAQSSQLLPDSSGHADREEKTLIQCTVRQKIKPVKNIGTGVPAQFLTHNTHKNQGGWKRVDGKVQHRRQELDGSLQFNKMQSHDRTSQSAHDNVSFELLHWKVPTHWGQGICYTEIHWALTNYRAEK